MAKKKEEMPSALNDAFKALSKMNTDSSTLSENALSVVDEYIDTGSMALNAIISGSLYGGVPKGRITGLVGPTGSGKTLILNKIIANAQKKDPDVWGVIWDTENAYDPKMVRNVGGNPNKIKVNPVATVEECRNQIATFLDRIIADPELNGKIIIGIDSLGNLASAKEISDAEKGKDAGDMGMRAKACLDPETLVLMGDGSRKKIKDLKVGDLVVTHLNRIKPIEDIWKTKKKTITLKTKNNEIKMSEDHKMLVKRDDSLIYVMAKDIKESDKLVKLIISSTFIEDQYEYIDIESIESNDTQEELIDINVQEDRTFCITNDNIISHNCKSMMRVLTHKCAKANATLIFSNHIYDDPASMFPSLIKSQAGGKGALYLASLLVQLAVNQEKMDITGEKESFIPMANRVKGVNLRALTVKNRFIPPFLETNMYLNFKTGLYKYSGLLEMAEAYDIVNRQGNTYMTADGEKLGFKKSFKDDDEKWNKILPLLDEALKKDLVFSSETYNIDNEPDDIDDSEND